MWWQVYLLVMLNLIMASKCCQKETHSLNAEAFLATYGYCTRPTLALHG